MVSIRLQRTGRRRHAQFRVVVQDSRRTPTSGRIVANLGFYNPHTKEHGVDLEKAAVYLKNGAQPSPRVVRFFTDQKVDLPSWVEVPAEKSKQTKHPEKLRRNQAAVAVAAEPAEETPVATESEEQSEKPPVEEAVETVAEPKAEEEETVTTESEETVKDNNESDQGGTSEEEADSKPDSAE